MMKRIAAREAKNRFGQLMDEAQREPITIEKNGRPVAVVMSLQEYQANEALKLEALQRELGAADKDFAAGRHRTFNEDVLSEIKGNARRRFLEDEKSSQ